MSEESKQVLVVGSVALDTIKTPFGAAEDILGGSASYFSIAARHFEEVAMVAVVGEDFPPDHVAFFEKHRVAVSGLETASGRTFRWSGEYGADFNTRETLDTQLNVFADFEPKQLSVLEQVVKPKLVVLDTMNFWIDGSRDELLEVMKRVDVVLLNDEEARMLSGESNLIKSARSVLELGPEVVVVKKGEHGALVVSREFMCAAPAYPVEAVFDPTGAGDTFAGGFLGYLAASEDSTGEAEIRRATAYGTVLASFTVEAFSLERLSTATREEIDSRFERLRTLAHF